MPLYKFRARAMLTILCMTLLTIVLAACGSDQATTAVQSAPTPTATHAATPSPTPTQAPTPTPTLALQPTSTPTPTPAQMTPAILDVRPSSMSIVGHLDCQQKGAYICLARVLSRAGNQGNLSWTSFTDIPGNVLFAPANGTLTPGQSTLITITIPLNDCKTGLFYFKGPANTHTISWAC